MRYFIFVFPVLLSAQTVRITSINATNAVMEISDYTGPCTIELSESATYSPVIPDFDATVYARANTDMERADTVLQPGVRLITAGHHTGNRSLTPSTTYYYRISGCGSTVTGSFVTSTIGLGTTLTAPPPFDAAMWGNLGYPQVDWTDLSKRYVDPIFGTKITLIPPIGNWRWGCGAGGCTSASLAFHDWAGGRGWTSPGDVLNGPASNAQTGNTNPVDLYADIARDASVFPWDPPRTLDDIGLVVWGSGSDAAAANRQITLCIGKNPDDGCFTDSITITLPSVFGPVPSGSSDSDQAWPANFPQDVFQSWKTSNLRYLRNEDYETSGRLSVSGGAMKIAALDYGSHFSSALKAGARIQIDGSAPTCPNNLCTLASVSHAGAGQLVENLTLDGTPAFRAYGWFVRVAKTNSTGSARVGLKYKPAGSNPPLGLQALGDHCSPVPRTAGDGKIGSVCEMTSGMSGTDYLYFIANDGTVRRLGNLIIPYASLSMAEADKPHNGQNKASPPFGFDSSDGNVYYVSARNNGTPTNGFSLYKLTYTGDYTQDLDFQYRCGRGGDCPQTPVQNFTWTNIMPPSTGNDLGQQIAARFPNYLASIYGPWTAANPTIQFVGVTGHYAVWHNVYGGQDRGGWLAYVDISTTPATVINLIHTIDGADGKGGTSCANCRWGGYHSGQVKDSPQNVLFLSNNRLNANTRGALHGGPFISPVTGVLRGGAWSINTALSWPPDGSYDNTCPANPYSDLGAAGNQCAVLRLQAGGVCNVAPAAAELARWPCPWNPGYAQPFALKAGDLLTEHNIIDGERLRIILPPTVERDGQLRVTVQRDGAQDYCCVQTGPHTNTRNHCLGSAAQAQHANGWTAAASPGTVNACETNPLVLHLSSGIISEMGRMLSGHYDIAGSGGENETFATEPAVKYNVPAAELAALPTSFISPGDPAWNGIPALIGVALQSYTHVGQYLAEQPSPWMLDMNPLVSCCRENVRATAGARTLAPVGGDIYKISIVSTGNTTYKNSPMVGVAGRFQLQDVSGPVSCGAPCLVDSQPYTMCWALNDGECHAGSMAGEKYVNVPQAIDLAGALVPGLHFASVPGIIQGFNAPGGGIRQQRIDQDDTNGGGSRGISYAWGGILRQYPYAHAHSHPSGNLALLSGPNYIDGRMTMGMAISMPPFSADNVVRNTWTGPVVAVTAKQGSTTARLRFGRDPVKFTCTARAEACVTDGDRTQPFKFAGERQKLLACATKCNIMLPGVSGYVYYYQVERMNNAGKVLSIDPAKAVAIGGVPYSPGPSDVVSGSQ